MVENLLLSTKELSVILNVSKQTVNNLRKRGIIPYYKAGRLFRYDLDEVKDALLLADEQVPLTRRAPDGMIRVNASAEENKES